ncbi:MAG: hypothetical protein IJ705_02635, partial [Oscillospiraceae bacterium]|nr:hypothetical protein [Oscillospiraceae bacterium]
HIVRKISIAISNFRQLNEAPPRPGGRIKESIEKSRLLAYNMGAFTAKTERGKRLREERNGAKYETTENFRHLRLPHRL